MDRITPFDLVIVLALLAMFIVGYAQTAPLVQLPIYFQIALGYGPILAVAATIPFMAALVLAGPVAGILGSPTHAYTRSLLASVPRPGRSRRASR